MNQRELRHSHPELQVEQIISGSQIHYLDGGVIWASRGQTILLSKDRGKTWNSVARIGDSLKAYTLGRSRLLTRLLRLGIHNILVLQSGTVLAITEGKIYRSTGGRNVFQVVHRSKRGKRPLREGFTAGSEGDVYYGEYWSNPSRKAVRLWKSEDGENWEVAFEFPPGRVRHIHAVQVDPFTNHLWLTTGDLDHECQIAFSSDGGQSFTPIGQGSQMWRAVSLVFTKEAVYWGSDNPAGHNHIYRWDRSSGLVEQIAPVRGPVYYGKRVGECLLFSTAVERQEGDQDGYARIYAIDRELNCHELYKLAKDRWHPVLFGYGVLEFARGDIDGESFWVTAKGLVGGQRSILFRLKA